MQSLYIDISSTLPQQTIYFCHQLVVSHQDTIIVVTSNFIVKEVWKKDLHQVDDKEDNEYAFVSSITQSLSQSLSRFLCS